MEYLSSRYSFSPYPTPISAVQLQPLGQNRHSFIKCVLHKCQHQESLVQKVFLFQDFIIFFPEQEWLTETASLVSLLSRNRAKSQTSPVAYCHSEFGVIEGFDCDNIHYKPTVKASLPAL